LAKQTNNATPNDINKEIISLSEAARSSEQQTVRRATPGSWRPGRSGNPAGRPKPEVDIAALARKHGTKCIEVVVRLMTRSKDEKIKLAAAIALLDRGFGRPKQEMDINSNSTIELHLVAARAISASLIEHQQTPVIEAIESTSTDIPTE
jgi:hypothetical protein